MSARTETPAEEMQRLIRAIGGKAVAGEKDEQLRARARRRLNMMLPPERHIGARRARSYWYCECADIPSDHMDRAREVAFLLPIEEAHDAVCQAETFIRSLRERLLARISGDLPAAPGADGGGPADRAAMDAAAGGDLGRLAPPVHALRLISSS